MQNLELQPSPTIVLRTLKGLPMLTVDDNAIVDYSACDLEL